MSDYLIRYRKAIDFLKTEMNYSYILISEKLENHKKQIRDKRQLPATSSSQLNKYYNDTKKFTVQKPLISLVESYLGSLRVTWNEQLKNYEFEEGAVYEEEFVLKRPFKNVKGAYEMYHLSYFSDTILKNIIWIDEEGEITIDAYSACTHKGKAEIFRGSFLSIQMHTLIHEDGGEEPFYYQIFANLNGNIQNGEIFHFFGISTTISITDEAMANKRVFIKLSNDENEQNQDWVHELLYIDDDEAMQKLNESKAGKLADYLIENSSIIIKEKTNQKL
ncbi:MAG: hypothetical protein COZ18_08460 [Flexibacter sp. CG_4_10_14_3_um_filter_32_15]|nr:MAG: hypothetical protein COZ18_08460 [Flexibacter sp. CG_4_10_14_3_um_filter_32_15]